MKKLLNNVWDAIKIICMLLVALVTGIISWWVVICLFIILADIVAFICVPASIVIMCLIFGFVIACILTQLFNK